MDLRQMHAFETLADELHFGRAAERLGISQPALSQIVRRLEADLGVELVARTTREVTLTRVGEIFLEGCKRTIIEATRAEDAARDAPRGFTGRLIIGTLGAGANGPLPAMIAAFRKRAGHVIVELHHFPDSATQERQVLAGSLDVAVVRSVANEQAIEAIQLIDEPFVVYLPVRHPLAGRGTIHLAELSQDPFVLWPRSVGPEYYDLIIRRCADAGFTPRLEGYGTSLESQLGLVAAGVGVSLQAASNRTIQRAGTVCVDLDPADASAPLWLAYRRRHHIGLVDDFVGRLRRAPSRPERGAIS